MSVIIRFMENDKLQKLREETIVAIEKLLDELYNSLPSLPEDFEAIEGEMDSDDIIGYPLSSEVLLDSPATYRYFPLDDKAVSDTTILWFKNNFVPQDDKEEVKQLRLEFLVEVTHEFGAVAVYKQGGEWLFTSKFLREPSSESDNANTTEGVAGLNLLLTVRGRLTDMLAKNLVSN